MHSLEAFRPFVFGYKVLCFIDQRSILWTLRKQFPSKFVPYRQRVAAYQPELIYIEGRHNIADWTSRFSGPALGSGRNHRRDKPVELNETGDCIPGILKTAEYEAGDRQWVSLRRKPCLGREEGRRIKSRQRE